MKRNRVISSSLAVVVAGIVVLVIAVSGGSANKSKPTPVNGGSAVSVKHTSLGNTLVDANGRTLYLFQADRPNVSTLSRAGFAVWPAFTSAGKPLADGGVSAAHIGTIAGPKGTRLVTYYGHPLYYYVGDKKPGETNGQGLNEFGARWYVLSANGVAMTSAPVAPAPATSESSGYGY
jgi:predicted lipoprotein with Yx(FWY)xxD motif